ncbi:ATP-binding protein [Aquibacillus sp. 3ASR75-11]|uniref:ATP-binding protein n=1 Tax=Terrihalobacillus insolitus TaxID=2950438 RepID=A0A9X3WUJ8_9BACI|nr:ATP-binding protein [Terrihalobacillus insolitus]MDC3414985.1 ATP-binding protein [Terrihalobacillus insolitus]MDC3425880.1 ATP-binding protein [Terrihalobacillus insolitus]
MKKLFSKFRHEQPLQEEQSPAISFPQLASFSSLQEVKKRATVGWIASRLAAMLEMNGVYKETLFYFAFMTQPLDETIDKESREILQLAESAVDWLEKNAVVEEEIKRLALSTSYHTNLSLVISEVQSEEDPQEDTSYKVWEVYRDVIYAATHGRFLLIDKQEIGRYKQGELLCEIEIKERKDIPKARELAQNVFDDMGLKRSKAMSYKLIISEAVTNILKHAEYGKMQIYKDEECIRMSVQDKGPGFSLKLLPQTTLMAGFSTKKSLGQGFTLMMKIAEQVVLETSSAGSTLILIVDGERDEINDQNEQQS